jgi:hypothetical protein
MPAILAMAGLVACGVPAAPDVRGAGDRLVFLREPPSTMTAGVSVSAGVRVGIVDAAGSLVARDGVPVVLRFVANVPDDSLPPSVLLTSAGGVAAVAPFVVGRPFASVRLVAVSPGLTGVLSQSFAVGAPMPPSQH